jgi:ribose transport system substrate-binding protein
MSNSANHSKEEGTSMTIGKLFSVGILAGAILSAPATFAETVGPGGEKATPSAEVKLTDADFAALKGKGYKAALLWHTSSDFINAVSTGAKDEFAKAGVKIVVETDAGFDATKQRNDIETALAAKPNVILSLPLDPTTSAAAFRGAVKDGVKLVFLSNLPSGYQQDKDYVTVVTDDLYQMGKHAADALATAIGKKGKVGYIFHDANYYVTNQRDQAFKSTIEKDYPNIKIVAEQGISDPARAEELANAMLLQHPDLDGIYVTWAEPAEGVLSALRANGNKTTKVVTLDLSEPVGLAMVKDGNVAAIVADKAYELGRAMAAAGLKGLLGQSVPPFVVAPALTVEKSNVAEGWKESLHREAPKSILDALK